jgi:hypothetical protein
LKRALATSDRFTNLLIHTESLLIGTPARPDSGKTGQLAGCGSLSFDEVVNHLFVANHRCFANFVAFETAVADISVTTKIRGWIKR